MNKDKAIAHFARTWEIPRPGCAPGGQNDCAGPDKAIIAASMGRQMVEKVKDVFGAGKTLE